MSKDVLIYAEPELAEHKLAGNLPPGDDVCFWSVNGTPRQTEPGYRVLFAYDGRVYAAAEIVSVEEGRLYFEPLERVDEVPPTEPVTRGFKYVESDG